MARRLKRAWARSHGTRAVFDGATAPENLTGELIGFIRGASAGGRAHLVIVDTADMGLRAGSICLLDHDDLAGVSFSTHQMPLSVLADYIQQTAPVDISFVAIQPKTVSFGRSPSPAVSRAVDAVAAALRDSVPGARALPAGLPRGAGKAKKRPAPKGGRRKRPAK